MNELEEIYFCLSALKVVEHMLEDEGQVTYFVPLLEKYSAPFPANDIVKWLDQGGYVTYTKSGVDRELKIVVAKAILEDKIKKQIEEADKENLEKINTILGIAASSTQILQALIQGTISVSQVFG